MADGRKVNLADPDYEPTDEDLTQLVQEAFADVTTRHAAALARLRAEISAARQRLILEHEERARG